MLAHSGWRPEYMVSREIVLIGLDRTLEIENKLAQLMAQYHDKEK